MTLTDRIADELPAIRATRSFLLASILVVGLLASAGSVAKAAPSVVDQYTEQVPSPGGDKTPQDSVGPDRSDGGTTAAGSTSGGSGGSGGSVSGGSVSGGSGGGELNQGSDLQTSGTAEGSGNSSGNGGSAGSANQEVVANAKADDSKSAVAAVVDGLAEEGDGSMGILFPLILVGSLMLVSAVVFIRRNGRNAS